MKRIAVVLCVAALVLVGGSALYAASNIYGIGGLIETPDDTITPYKAVQVTGNYITNGDIRGIDDPMWTFGGAYGLLPKLEVGAVAIDSNAPGAEISGVGNVKYRVLNESLAIPSVSVGIVDLANQLDGFSAHIADPSGFIVFGKNITGPASRLTGGALPSLKGTLGFGTGIYKGVFAGVDWAAAPKFSVIGEYLSNGLRQKTTFSAALRYTPIPALNVQVGTFAFEGLYVGASYALSLF